MHAQERYGERGTVCQVPLVAQGDLEEEKQNKHDANAGRRCQKGPGLKYHG